MAVGLVKLASEVIQIIRDPFEKPTKADDVGENLIRLTGRTTAFAAGAAIILAILNKCSKQNGPVPAITSRLLQASLSTAATSAVMLICYVYQCCTRLDDRKIANEKTVLFEKIIIGTGAIADLGAFFAPQVFKRNETIISVARYSSFPLLFCAAAATVISIFHQNQLKQII